MYDHIFKFIDKEISDLDNRIVSNGKLNMQEIQYVDLLSHIKKSMLTVDAMESYGEGYSDGYNHSGESYSEGYHDNYRDGSGYGARGRGRGAKRDSMGRYATGSSHYQDSGSMISELHNLMNKAPDEPSRRKIEEFISEMDRMN